MPDCTVRSDAVPAAWMAFTCQYIKHGSFGYAQGNKLMFFLASLKSRSDVQTGLKNVVYINIQWYVLAIVNTKT